MFFSIFAKLAIAFSSVCSFQIISYVQTPLAHDIHSPQPMYPLLLLLVQQAMVAWLDTVNYHNFHFIHISPVLLIKMLSQTPHPRLAVLSVAIVAANKPSLIE
jgi:hypothetical protein